MCGVIGFFSLDPTRDHLLKIVSLFKASKIRGLHAFGYSTWEPKWLVDKIRTAKFHTLLELEASLREYELNPPDTLIGHGRYSTSGDFKDHSNNQPIHIPGVSVVFNGVISMKTKAEREKEFKTSYTTDNDGEIVARMGLDEKCDLQGFIRNGKFSFAGLFLFRGKVFAIRNKNRPLWYSRTKGGVFVASTRDIFLRAGGFETPKPVPEGRFWELSCLP